MKWSPQQDEALVAVASWLRDPDRQVFRLFGYAGSGKTTLAKYFAEGVDGHVMFGAFTGKATHVLKQKGCPNAATIHSMIYHSKEKGKAQLKTLEAELLEVLHELRTIDLANDTPEFREEYINKDRTVINLRGKINAEKNSLARPMFTLNPEADMKHAALVVIDECSMVDEPMGEDLLSFGTKVLVLGDPAQLPPIKGSGFFTDCEPDFMLTEIHRQARDNPIIHMATQVRLKKNLEIGSYGDSKVIDIRDVNKEMALEADQILVGRNKSRTMYNNRMRVLKGINDRDPVGGDRLVCLRNDHEVGLLNGAIWYVEDVDRIEGDRVYMTVRPEDGGDLLDVDSHRHYFLGIGDQLPWYERKEAQEFDYGYALTVHKSQGSQWDCTLLFDEGDCFRQHKWKWRYTGLTRAAETVTVVVN